MNPKLVYDWNADRIRALRRYMGLSQQQMSERLGIRQQTVSEWETGMYQPRGGMVTLLTMVAEREGFPVAESLLEPQAEAQWLHQPIARLHLKPRATAALQAAGLRTVEQALALWREDRRKLLAVSDFGPRSLQALEDKLRELHLIY